MVMPFAKPFLGEEEVAAAREAILSGWVTQGPRVKRFEEAFASYVRAKYASAASNCTAALHLALLAVGVSPGDIVVTVSHSFIATANSIRHCGAEPLFIDIDIDTLNISPKALEECLSRDCKVVNGKLFYRKARVAAVMPVHQIGMPCDLETIIALARKFGLPVIEDAACAIGSEINYKGNWDRIGKPHGEIACFSFHPRKILTTGEGGMLTTNNADYDKKVKLLRDHGSSLSDVVRHTSKRMMFEEYNMTGYNYRMTDIQAAIGLVQLEKITRMIEERRMLAALYNEKLKDILWLKLVREPSYARTNWQSYPVMVRQTAPLGRDGLIQYLLDKGVATRRGVMNSHQERAYSSGAHLKNSEYARDSVMLLPIFNGMKAEDLDAVVKVLKDA